MSLNPNLIAELTAVVGEKWIVTNPADLYMYSFDSALDRSTPPLAVLPENQDQVARVVTILSKYKQPFVARGAATSLCGGPVPLQNAVVIALARLKRIGRLDPMKKEITVEPGVINLKLQNAVSAQGLFYPPDPGSQKACTIGGNVATNAGGPHCLKYGVTSQYVAGLDIVLPDGKLTKVNIDDPGFDLTGFFVGSEGTLGIATTIRLRLLPKPAYIRTMLVSFSSIEEAIQSVTDIIAAGILPATLEAMDRTIVTAVEAFVHAGYPLEAEAVLLIELDGDKPADLDIQGQHIREICEKNNSFDFRFAKDEAERLKLWEGRRGSYAAMARLAPNVLVEDGAVPRTMLPQALAKIQEIAETHGLRVAMLFHAGDGNLHPQIIFDERDKKQTAIVKEAGYQMLKACVDLGGTISGEHGIGTDKREAMRWLFSRETLSLFRRIKNAFDPENLCNPEKLIPLVSKAVAGATPDKKISDEKNYNLTALGQAEPQTEEELVLMVKDFGLERKQFGIQGSGSRYKVHENIVVTVTKLNQVLDFDKGNLTLTVQAGAKVDEIRALVEQDKQYLWVAGGGTIGGLIASRGSAVPALRDQILGMRVLLSNGEIVKFGAKTMKNVAGYDAAKLLIGSWGTLGVILDVTFRLFPYPAKELKVVPTQPFVFRDLHKRIKAAFDLPNILSLRTAMLSQTDLTTRHNATREITPQAQQIKQKMGDDFWGSDQ
jgi:glycolate oxidase subunit GlcD